MFQLSEKQAQEIVDKMMRDIPYNINIMNDRGVIVGSGRPDRVGTVHEGAVRALATGRMVEVREDGRFEKKGTNEPIVIGDKRVGVIGITGEPDEVRPFCNIVRTTVSLLIEQKTALETLAREVSRRAAFIRMLLEHRGPYTQKIRKEAAVYGIDLALHTTVLLLTGFEPNEESAPLLLRAPSFAPESGVHLLLLQGDGAAEPLLEPLLKRQPRVRASSGRREALVADSYAQARAAMNVRLALRPSASFLRFEDVEFLAGLGQADLPPRIGAAARLEDYPDLLDTLRVFIGRDGSMSASAAELNIHRNTLQYRLGRIAELTGKDPRRLLELFQLVHDLLAESR
ncbi:sugar diacid recognition domain-containing protein [Saccharibacillus sp. CPCC 101409]|uniref:CdaR family transcriptional regulator n=1 Tax=Saccharibacillus sp. CPCC 101409 TaxID=3058041 RepID=UPI002671E458|nr:sugar diacid recognition domain-containing protein [Saccharibacillus sp. CPCC 101409]MDO3409882.1 sugar diacid recognition domain-containing protein [Saccharibacillus sp. CPCC 101409]